MQKHGSKSALVTGADGFIGSHLVERLVTDGANVTALAQYNAKGENGWLDSLEQAVLDSIDIQRGDLRDPAFIRDLVDGNDIVFHLGALISIPYSYLAPQSYIDVNVTGTLNVLDAARKTDVERVIHTSTSEVYGTALFTPIAEAHPLQGQSPYAASKIGADMMAEAYARSFDLPVVILRPFNTYGPRQSERAVIPTVIRQALDPECTAIHVGSLEPKRDFNYVADTAAAFLCAGFSDNLEYGSPYNAGSGTEFSIGEMIDKVLRITGVNKPVKVTPDRIRPANSEVMELIADAEKLHLASGWSSETCFEAGLERTISWWRDAVSLGGLRRSAEFLR